MTEAEAGPEKIRLLVVQTKDAPTRPHVEKWLESNRLEGFEIEITYSNSIGDAEKSLSEHECDLVAIEAIKWYNHNSEERKEMPVATSLPRREESHILVASDRPSHIPYKSIILSPNKLKRRQLRRYRADYRVMSPVAFADTVGMPIPSEEEGLEMATWLEDLRSSGTINGYTLRRHLFDETKIDTRRHKLMVDPREGETVRFLPSPLQGLTLLVSRNGFPSYIADLIGDEEAKIAWEYERILLNSIGKEIHDRIGLIVRYRQIGSLLKQAESEKDLMRSTSLLDAEGEIQIPKINEQPVKYESLIEILIETMDKTGTRTLLLERLIKKDQAEISIRFMANDWETMLNATTAENLEDPRLGPYRPPFFDI